MFLFTGHYIFFLRFSDNPYKQLFTDIINHIQSDKIITKFDLGLNK